MSFLFIKAFLRLIQFDAYLVRGNFSALHHRVHTHKVSSHRVSAEAVRQICSALDLACIWYPRQAMCLQRSAAATCLLRSYGVPAQMVIGVQKLPFKAHAWVEVDGQVVNDKSEMPEVYAVLEKC